MNPKNRQIELRKYYRTKYEISHILLVVPDTAPHYFALAQTFGYIPPSEHTPQASSLDICIVANEV